jgi:hypothetical protein
VWIRGGKLRSAVITRHAVRSTILHPHTHAHVRPRTRTRTQRAPEHAALSAVGCDQRDARATQRLLPARVRPRCEPHTYPTPQCLLTLLPVLSSPWRFPTVGGWAQRNLICFFCRHCAFPRRSAERINKGRAAAKARQACMAPWSSWGALGWEAHGTRYPAASPLTTVNCVVRCALSLVTR